MTHTLIVVLLALLAVLGNARADLPLACGPEEEVPVCTEYVTQGWLEEKHPATCFSVPYTNTSVGMRLRVWIEILGSDSNITPRLCTTPYGGVNGTWTSVESCSRLPDNDIAFECYKLIGLDSDVVYFNVYCEDDACKNSKVDYTIRFDYLAKEDQCAPDEESSSSRAPTDPGSALYGALAIGIVVLVFLMIGVLIGLRCFRLRRQVRRHAYGY